MFYEYFLRAATGEENWKKKLREGGNGHRQVQGRISTPLNESFALVLLKNNYWAWLLDGMEEHGDFKTEYDDDLTTSTGGRLVEYLLQGACIDVVGGSVDKGYVEVPSHNTDDDEACNAYNEANKRYKESEVVSVRNKTRDSTDFKRVRSVLLALSDMDGLRMEREKKRRRMVKELKEYTGGRKGSEKTFRGWSKRAYRDMSVIKKAIERDYALYDKFDLAYKSIHARQQQGKSSLVESGEGTDNEEEEEEYLDGLFDFSGTS